MHIEKPDMYIISPSSVHLTWHAARVPSTTSHLSPTTYRVEVREDGTFNWVERASNITGLGCDIGGLNPMLDYAFRVRAVNDFGWSEATLPVFLHRPIGERLLSYTTVFLRVFFICVASCGRKQWFVFILRLEIEGLPGGGGDFCMGSCFCACVVQHLIEPVSQAKNKNKE